MPPFMKNLMAAVLLFTGTPFVFYACDGTQASRRVSSFPERVVHVAIVCVFLFWSGWTLVRYGISIFKTLKSKLGLNPGEDFEQWLTSTLAEAGISTLEDLEKLRSELPKLKYRIDESEVTGAIPKLAIITSDITIANEAEGRIQ